LAAHSNLIACLGPVVSNKVDLPKFREHFGWNSSPPWKKVAENLAIIASFWASQQSPPSNKFLAQIEESTSATYRYFAGLPLNDFNSAIALLKQAKIAWIWIPLCSSFVHLSAIAIKSPPVYEPHLFAAPDALTIICDRLRIQAEFPHSVLLNLLRHLYTKAHKKALNESTVECVLALLTQLAPSFSPSWLATGEFPLLSQNNYLIPLKDAIYNDTLEQTKEDNIIHPQVRTFNN